MPPIPYANIISYETEKTIEESVMEIISTFASDHMIIAGVCPVVAFAFIFGIGFYIFLSSLWTAYVIQPDKIVKGIIIGNAYRNSTRSLTAELYKRKEYHNPQLIKETKHFYIYRCDSKKLKIRKVYTGMDRDVQNVKEVSILKRVVVKALLVFVMFSAISIADIAIGLANNSNYNNNITENYTKIETELVNLGYESEQKYHRFEKTVSPYKKSHIQYSFDVDGSVEDAEFEIYFDQSSDRVDQEIEYIFTSLDDGISRQQIERFIQDTQSTIQGNYVYNKLQTDHYTIILGTSDGHAHIHN